VFGNGKKGVGKKLIRTDDVDMLCDMDEFGNIIPGTCEQLVAESRGQSETLAYPKPKVAKKI